MDAIPLRAPLRCVTFDADGTLFDFATAMRAALAAALHAIHHELGARVGGLTLTDLILVRNEVAAAMPGATHEAIRRRSFSEALRRLGAPNEGLAEALYTAYMADRYRLCAPYADVRPCLETLRGRYGLGVISNGNSHPERCGLPGVFDWVVLAQEVGAAKPALGLFALAAQRAGCRAEALLHVGDDPEEDVRGALAAGLQAVWLNRAGVARPADLPACPEIATLAELPRLLQDQKRPSLPFESEGRGVTSERR
jgi:putative hydrolase of the HAD superfamily